jgi:glycolate oxidase
VPVTPRGSGFGYVGGCVPVRGGIALSVARMNGIKEINFADGVAVWTGVITADLQGEARKRGLFYPPDPASMKDCSIGGNIATKPGGPRCLKYGVTRNYVLGLEVVSRMAGFLRSGARTHKNKTGSTSSACLSERGIARRRHEATLRLLPLPPARASLSASFQTFREVRQRGSGDLSCGLPSGRLGNSRRLHLALTLGKHCGRAIVPDGEGHVLVDLDGQPPASGRKRNMLSTLLSRIGALRVEKAFGETACERPLGTSPEILRVTPKATGLTKLNEDITVPRSRLVDLAEFAARLRKKHGFPVACFGHAGDGNIHTNIMAANYHSDPAIKRRVDVALDELSSRSLRGAASLPANMHSAWRKCRVATGHIQCEPPVHADLKAALIRKAFSTPANSSPSSAPQANCTLRSFPRTAVAMSYSVVPLRRCRVCPRLCGIG